MRHLLPFEPGRKGLTLVVLLSLLVCRCGSPMGTPGGADTTTDGGSTSDAGPNGGQAAFILNIINYNNGCSVTEDGGTYTPMAAFVAGSHVGLHATPVAGQAWGYWTGTDGDTGSSHDSNMATTVTMDANKQVLACCPSAPPAAQVCPTPMP